MSITGQNEGPGRETSGRPLSTADLAAATARSPGRPGNDPERGSAQRGPGQREPARREAARQSGQRGEGEPAIGDDEATGTFEAPSFGASDTTAAPQAAAPQAAASQAKSERQDEALEPLFTPDMAETYRRRWISIQSSFVDDPHRAVRSGDELVAQVMTNLAKTFAEERHRVEAQLDETGEGVTENLRVALRRYRSFFERLLSL